MIMSYYDGSFSIGQMRLTILARLGSSTGAFTGSRGSPGGHTYLAFEWYHEGLHRHAVYHLVGERDDSARGSGHAVVGTASVEKLISGVGEKLYLSVGGRSGTRAPNLHDTWHNSANDTPAKWNKKATVQKSVNVPKDCGRKALKAIHKYTTHTTDAGSFSLAGANMRLGTNCVTFALDILKEAGVVPDWTMYLFSFGSPYQAITRGSLRTS